MRRALLAAALLLLAACASTDLSRHPVRSEAYWKPALSRPLTERVGAAPPELVEYLRLDNARHGLSNKPRAARLAPDFLKDVREAMAGLPPPVAAPLHGRLAGIYFVEDLGGTGFFDEVNDASGRAVAGFTVLDPSVLQRSANAWATWKESSPFQAGGGTTLRATIQDAKGDTRASAIQYILLHELGHMLSIGAGVHPSWSFQAKDVPDLARFSFARLSWRHSADREAYASRFDAAFPQRKDVVYYFGAKLPAAQMLATYDALERTDFVTLYGATNPYDDFAESFASYVHVVLMGRPWEIRIEQDGRLLKSYGPCWEAPRCAEKRRLLEALLR